MYVGAVPLSALKVSRIILNLMRLSMGSQCSADRMGVMCSWWRALCTILAAIFWSLCSFPMSFSVRLARRALHESKRDVTKAWTSVRVVCLSRYWRIWPIFRMAVMADRQRLLICVLIVRCSSIITPRFLTSAFDSTFLSPTMIETEGEDFDTNLDDR